MYHSQFIDQISPGETIFYDL